MVDYATTSKFFLVTWRIGAYQIRAARISATGQNLDAPFPDPTIGVTGAPGILVSTAGGERDASVAYNPENDTFLVSYADFLGGGHTFARLLSAATGQLGPQQELAAGVEVHMTDVTYSTSAHRFLVGWVQLPGGATGRLVSADGTPTGAPIPLSSRFGTYDSFGIAYNALTQSSLAIGQDRLSYENGGVEISDSGVPGLSTVLTNAGGPTGNFYPQVSASTTEPKWLLTTAHNFTSVVAQFATAPAKTTAPPPTAKIAKPRNDFDGDGRSDPLIWRPGTGTWYWLSSSATNDGSTGTQWGNVSLGDVSLTGDIDGDGKADLVIWRASTGTWYWLTSSSGYSYAASGAQQWGNQSLGDIPMLADMDADGKSDLLIWRPAEGNWYWLTSSSGYDPARSRVRQWGNIAWADQPLTGDVDADGHADLAVWRPLNGVWYWLTSSSGYNPNASLQVQWGNHGLGDRPLVGDFDGDRRTDMAVWRASTGSWFWLQSSKGYAYSSYMMRQWGNASLGDVPMVIEVDGDGKADIAVWRATTATWFWLPSSSGYSASASGSIVFGHSTDIPIK